MSHPRLVAQPEMEKVEPSGEMRRVIMPQLIRGRSQNLLPKPLRPVPVTFPEISFGTLNAATTSVTLILFGDVAQKKKKKDHFSLGM